MIMTKFLRLRQLDSFSNGKKLQNILNELISKQLLAEKSELVDPELLFNYFSQSPVTYWGDAQVKEILLRYRYPDHDILLSMANAVTEGKLRFGRQWNMEQTSQFETLTNPIDWQAVPNGDLEWTHSLLRLYHLLDLAIAFDLTGEKRYLDTIDRHISSFNHARLCLTNVISQNRLDAALRINNLVRAMDLLRRSEAVPATMLWQIIGLITAESNYLVSQPLVDVGNWEFFITIALLMSSLYLRKCMYVTAWLQAAEKRLNEIIDSEILADGNLIEAVPMYHGQCTLLLLDYFVMLKNNAVDTPSHLLSKLERMIESLIRIANPEYKIPQIGDSDAFDINYILDYAHITLGKEFTHNHTATNGLSVDYIKDTNWVVIRFLSKNNKQHFFLFDLSGKPPSRRNWHSHADDLQFLYHDGETDVFIDPGRFTYSSYFKRPLPLIKNAYKPIGIVGFFYHLFHPRFRKLNKRDWRSHFRHTLTHNTISCDGKMQRGYTHSDYISLEEYPTKVSTLFHHQEGPLFYTGGLLEDNISWLKTNKRSYDSRRKESDSYSHRRYIFGYTPHCLVVYDSVFAEKPHNWICSYHFGPQITVVPFENNGLKLTTEYNRSHYLKFFNIPHGAAQVALEDDWVSPIYNQMLRSRIARLTVKGKQAARIILVLIPSPVDDSLIDDDIACQMTTHALNKLNTHMMLTITLGAKRICVYFNDTPQERVTWNGIESDAALSIVEHEYDRVTAIGFIKGSFLRLENINFTFSSNSSNFYTIL